MGDLRGRAHRAGCVGCPMPPSLRGAATALQVRETGAYSSTAHRHRFGGLHTAPMGGESRNTGAGAAWSGPVSQVLPNAVLSVEALAVAAVEPRPQPQAPQTLLKKPLGTTPTLRPRSGCGAGVAATRLPPSGLTVCCHRTTTAQDVSFLATKGTIFPGSQSHSKPSSLLPKASQWRKGEGRSSHVPRRLA